jgi:hypothetical protein
MAMLLFWVLTPCRLVVHGYDSEKQTVTISPENGNGIFLRNICFHMASKQQLAAAGTSVSSGGPLKREVTTRRQSSSGNTPFIDLNSLAEEEHTALIFCSSNMINTTRLLSPIL